MSGLRVNDFFCGCGGMGLAFRRAGFEIAGAWDYDKYAVQSYRENVGNHVEKTDIRDMAWNDIPKADVWAFGFPCQDLSVAGGKKGMVVKCQDCGCVHEIDPKEYDGKIGCPECGGNNIKSESRSGCFFEMMRLLQETKENAPLNMPTVIIAENVKGLKPYLKVLEVEYEKVGYVAHHQLFNSKYWNVAQSRERYAVVGIKADRNISFSFPAEQHSYIPKLSGFLDENVDEKYYIEDSKAKTILKQAFERLASFGSVHATLTPDRESKRQRGPRAKPNEAPMFTLTAQDIHGVIVAEDSGGGYENPKMITVGKLDIKGPDTAKRVYHPEGISPTLTTSGGGGTGK